ncbi:glycosyltransferase family 4 protein [Oscillatoria sp. CS-180]|uniref:glycosyltransferase family 4 protein n=1 Tax=Oscillatoria sp. CS-180 TaxID=3021720 RepID=UPI00232D7880|nr:glycosyltransferase family 4 protein [Oscillatoria sp. CS-180]MDB9529343.1 glycosyltransferase family 4 protein [Oscillatoria sp. CS-180]
MKILLVNDYATPTGGAELLMFALRDGLRRRGHDARLFSTNAQAKMGDRLADYECLGTTSRFRTLLQSWNPWAARRLQHVLTDFQPQIVHVKIFLTQLSPSILPLLQTIPSLYYVAWYRPICPLGNKILPNGSPCAERYGAACYRNGCVPLHDWLPLMKQMQQWRQWQPVFDRIVANSHAVQRQLIAEGIPSKAVIECGVPRRSPRPPLTSSPTVVFAGRLVREKGVDILLQAFRQVIEHCPDAKLLIAGDGPERDHLQALITELGLSEVVSLLGHLPRDIMEMHFNQAWVQAVPSRWAEPFGMVAAEAMMRGTAVVASASGGLADIVQNGKTGVLVPPGNITHLASALLLLLQDRSLSETWGQAGRAIALTQFDESAFVDKFVDQYEAILGESARVERKAYVF